MLARWLHQMRTTRIPDMMVRKVSWKKKLEIKIKVTEIKLLKDTMLVIKSRGMKKQAQRPKNWTL